MSKEAEIAPEKIKRTIIKLVEEMIKILNKKKIQIFKNKPTINIFHLKNEMLGVSLINENQNEIRCPYDFYPTIQRCSSFLRLLRKF